MSVTDLGNRLFDQIREQFNILAGDSLLTCFTIEKSKTWRKSRQHNSSAINILKLAPSNKSLIVTHYHISHHRLVTMLKRPYTISMPFET